MRTMIARALALAFLVTWAGCDDGAVAGLKGRWVGTIGCAVDTAEVTIGLQLSGEQLVGDAITRVNEINSDWRIEGAQRTLQRTTRCRDDTCETDADCASRGGGSCNRFGICDTCEEREDWREVTLTMIDEDVQSTDPVMTLERFGDDRLAGSVAGFCPDENLGTPSVELGKEQ